MKWNESPPKKISSKTLTNFINPNYTPYPATCSLFFFFLFLCQFRSYQSAHNSFVHSSHPPSIVDYSSPQPLIVLIDRPELALNWLLLQLLISLKYLQAFPWSGLAQLPTELTCFWSKSLRKLHDISRELDRHQIKSKIPSEPILHLPLLFLCLLCLSGRLSFTPSHYLTQLSSALFLDRCPLGFGFDAGKVSHLQGGV